MIKFARGLAASGVLLFSAGLALADAPPESKTEPAPAARIQAPATPLKRPAEPRVIAASPECAWSGRRIISLLVRDDVDTADKHRRFYEQFGCPTAHVGLALRCVIQSELPAAAPAQGSVQQGQAQARALAERVEQCWDKPSVKFLNR
jgi:hypothetical protein